MKQILNREWVQRVLAALIAGYVRGMFRLTRWTVEADSLHRHGEAGTPCIACFWHGRMILTPNFWQYRMPLYLLGSPHRDGLLVRRLAGYFGVRSIVGSTTHGGTGALREMLRRIQEGSSIALAPDGPRGPRMRASPGVIALAKLSGAAIIPLAFSVTRGRVLGTWDCFLAPYPFGRGVFIAGPALTVAADADAAALEVARLELETRLNELTAECDRRCGRAPVVPAEALPQMAGESA